MENTAEDFLLQNDINSDNVGEFETNGGGWDFKKTDIVGLMEEYHQSKLKSMESSPDDSDSFSSQDMKDFASALSGKKVGDLDLILFKNDR